MEATNNLIITVETIVNTTIEKAWQYWTLPQHIMQWNNASDDWHTPNAINDLQVGGQFVYTMAAKDGSFSFDFSGVYDEIEINKHISYTLMDGRKVSVHFLSDGNETKVIETFEPETQNTHELQKQGWQAILNNFKKYSESN